MNGNPAPDIKAPPELDRMAVKIAHLDRLLGLTGEIIITASNVSILQRHLATQNQNLDRDSQEMIKNTALTANRISSDLHHLVMDIRLVPIKETFLRFRRLVRDIAKKRGRQVNFEMVGEDTLVDKTVAEKLYEPLAHQIRNAIDHGLEDPLERKSFGKDPTGQLILTANKKEGYTYVSVTDDGRGLDEKKIRRTLVDKWGVTPGAAAGMPKNEVWAAILQPGFSTMNEATEISGRGVGMDVVKSTVEALGGEVLIDSLAGKGSVFTYKIPQLSAVNITDALIIRAGESHYAVPIGNVVATQAVLLSEINTTMEKAENIIYLGDIVPLYDLRTLLTGSAPAYAPNGRAEQGLGEEEASIPIIIIEAKNGRVALKVSEFIRPQKLVLIPMPEVFNVLGISGATILGGNQLGMVIDPYELIALATGDRSGAVESSGFNLNENAAFGEEDFLPDASSAETGEKIAPPAEDSSLGGLLGANEEMAEEFLIEIQGILTELNEEIFQLEKKPDDMRRLNTIFRYFHSIKGNFIMTGFTKVGDFVHQVETVLDRIREKELKVDQDVVDLLLDAVKLLETGLVEIQAGRGYEITDAEVIQHLEAYKPMAEAGQSESDSEPGDGEAFQLSPLGQILFQAKINSPGMNIYQSMVTIKPVFQSPALVAYLILRRLALVGDLIDTVPPLERLEKGLSGNKIKIMFSSTRSIEEINRFFTNQLIVYYDVSAFENMLME